MSEEVKNAANIGKRIPSKNPIPMKKPSMKKSSSKVRGKGKADSTYSNKGAGSKEYVGKTGPYEGEVIEPSVLPSHKPEPEIYDAEIVETPKAIAGRRAISYSPITQQPSTKKKKPGYTQPTLPGMRNTRQFRGINGPSS